MTAKAKPAPKPAAPKRKRGRSTGGVLPEEIRDEIVMRLAMFDVVAEIRDDLVERGYDITHQTISAYNPYNVNGKRAPKRKALFDKTREEFLANMVEIPIASRAFRIRKLQEIMVKALKRGATAEARAAIEQAAKEVGNVYTNLAKVQGTIDHTGLGQVDRTDDESRNMLADRLGEALLRLPKKQAAPTIQ